MGSNQLSTMLQELEVKVDTADPQQALVSYLSRGLRNPVYVRRPQ